MSIIPIDKYHFTENALDLLNKKAVAIAKKFNSPKVTIEHIVIAILEVNQSILDEKLGISCRNIVILIEELIAPQSSNNIDYIHFSNEVNNMLNDAMYEAKKRESQLININHILMAIVGNHVNNVNIYLHRLGFSYETLSSKLFDINISTKSALKLYCIDLNEKALNGKINPIFGRENEIERLLRILNRKLKNNPVLLGEAGVGKTAVIEGVVLKIISGKAPDSLKNKHFFSLDISMLISGTKYRGEFEERLNNLLNELKNHPNAILFIDELHTIVGTGGENSSLDASNILKPALSRSEIQIVGATTIKEYKRYIEKDSALERRFQVIKVEEPSKEDAILMMEGLKSFFEKAHGVVYTKEAIFEAVELSTRYLTDRYLPDKAIDLLDEAGALKRLEYYRLPTILDSMEVQFNNLEKEINEAILSGKHQLIIKLQERFKPLTDKINALRNTIKNTSNISEVTHNDIRTIVSELVGINEHHLNSDLQKKLITLEKDLKNQIIGQNEAINCLVSAIRRSWVGLNNLERPLASFLFVGRTGVGKTLLAKKLSKTLFNNDNALIRIDMNEYNEKHLISRLIGSPPGYVGYGEGGELTEKVRQNPYCVILFDEIEKAHKDVFNIILQVLEEGHLKDSMGRVINFKHSIIILTSNAGSETLLDNPVGFSSSESYNQTQINKDAYNSIKQIFSAEFLNRIDEIIYFNVLSKDNIGEILRIELDMLTYRLVKDQSVYLSITDEAKKHLINLAYSPIFGARSLRRVFNKTLIEMLAIELLTIEEKPADLEVVLSDGNLAIVNKNIDKNIDKNTNNNVGGQN